MIKLKMSIEDISEYQTGILPKNAVKIETPQNIEEMMKKAAPIAAVLCILMFVTMLCKTVMNKTVVISHVFILIGFCLGFCVLYTDNPQLSTQLYLVCMYTKNHRLYTPDCKLHHHR